jgi:hypothetical protein
MSDREMQGCSGILFALMIIAIIVLAALVAATS